MVDNSPNSSQNNPKKRNNPFKKLFDDVKRFIKKDGEEDRKPSSSEVPNKEKSKESNIQSESSNKKSENLNKRPHGSNKRPRRSNKLSSSLNKQSDDSGLPKMETPETKEAERSARARKGNAKEQKLPKKYKKGW